MSNKIQVLDNETINKIAAGEIIESPFSIVKELIENSIDAGATLIDIEIKSGGKKYIRVTDNGSGISSNDIKMAFMRHSTSKIKSSKDLSKIMSLGFRGEALASIAAVSHIEVITKTPNSLEGKHVKIHGGDIMSSNDTGCPEGTTIIVRNLFYNTPVRKKFLKTNSVEASKISSIINKITLAYPSISFKYIRDNKLILKTPGDNKLINTINYLFGKDFSKSLYEINYHENNTTIYGFISRPSHTRGNRKHQYIFINNRYIKSKLISNIIKKAYGTLIPKSKFPIFILKIKMNPQEVDVNIHPTKTEVKFKDELKLKNMIYNIIKDNLKNRNLIYNVNINKKNANKNYKPENDLIEILDLSNDKNHDTKIKSDIFNKEHNLIDYIAQEKPNKIYENNKEYKDTNGKKEEKSKKEHNNICLFPDLEPIGTLFNTYILAQNVEKNVFYMIDQHAAHERINYEKYKNQYLSENVITQKLITPKTINLTHSECEQIIENKEMFKKLGFDLGEFGNNTIIIRSVPMVFGEPNLNNLFYKILDNLDTNINNNYELMLEKISKLACTNSIKGGDNIKLVEIKKLIHDLRNTSNPYTCPHGRPIVIEIKKQEIERKFKRI